MKHSAIIVAGGSGKRMGAPIPKQFLLLKGEPILFHSIRAFHAFDPAIELVLVLPAEHSPTWNELCEKHDLFVPHQIVAGGQERYHSVKAGLERIGNDGLVAIHDGVRPLIGSELIARCFRSAMEHGSGIPVIPVKDSVREVDEGESRSIDRSRLRIVQTPQCFQLSLIKKAFDQPFDPNFTDEATMLERIGASIHLVNGEERNLKITTGTDLAIAGALLD